MKVSHRKYKENVIHLYSYASSENQHELNWKYEQLNLIHNTAFYRYIKQWMQLLCNYNIISTVSNGEIGYNNYLAMYKNNTK